MIGFARHGPGVTKRDLGRWHSRRFMVSAVLAAILGLTMGQMGVANALFTDSETDASTFTTASSFTTTYYLHNNPTPPTGNTNAQANLTQNTTAPTATTLYNYDSNRDSSAGLLVTKGGSGATETDLTKYQNWRTGNFATADTINGTVTFTFWSAIKDFGTSKRGEVKAFLRKYNPSGGTYVEIANATLDVANWQGGSGTWVQKTLNITVTNHTIEAGRQLELKIIVGGNSGDDMWFAYDTTTYTSSIAVP